MALISSPVPYYLSDGLLGDGDIYDFYDAPNDIEHRRKDDAYEEENKWIIKYSLKSWNAFRWLNVNGFVTHGL